LLPGLIDEFPRSKLRGILRNSPKEDKVTPNGKIEASGIDQLLKMFQGEMGA